MLWVSGERGQAMILALLIVGVGLVVTVALATMGTGAIKISRAHTEDVKALYIAEAGMERAIAQIRLQPSWEGFTEAVSYDGGSFEVDILDNGVWDGQMARVFTVESTGYFEEARKTLVSEVRIRLHEAVWGWPGMFVDGEPSQAWNGSLSLEITDENLDDVGKVFVRGNLTVSGNSQLQGDSLYVVGRLTVGGSAKVDMQEVFVSNGLGFGTSVAIKDPDNKNQKGILVPSLDKCVTNWVPDNAPPQVFTDDLVAYYQDLASDEGIQVWDHNLSNLNGIYRHTGNLTLSGEYKGYGTIIVQNGDITVTGGLAKQAGEEGGLTLVTVTEGKQLKVQTCTLEANVVARKLWLNGSAGLIGTIIAQDVVMSGGGNSINFDFDPEAAIANDMALPGTTITISSWKEKHGVF